MEGVQMKPDFVPDVPKGLKRYAEFFITKAVEYEPYQVATMLISMLSATIHCSNGNTEEKIESVVSSLRLQLKILKGPENESTNTSK
jgi:hypothetical protein